MTKMRVEEVESRLREVLARVDAGETFEIESDGRTVARLSPCDPVMARLEKSFPGLKRSTAPASSVLGIRPMRLPIPVDSVELVRDEREDREFLR